MANEIQQNSEMEDEDLKTTFRLMHDANIAQKFIRESNRIEGVIREPTPEELIEYYQFMDLTRVDVMDLEAFVHVYEPGTELRDMTGMDVRVGKKYKPPSGGPNIRTSLKKLLESDMSAYKIHVEYERLHPFNDCNGRSGRMLWAWKMREFPLGFLHTFYYQALSNER